MGEFIFDPFNSVKMLNLGVERMSDCGKRKLRKTLYVVPCMARSSALSFPPSPESAAIQDNFSELAVVMLLIAERESIWKAFSHHRLPCKCIRILEGFFHTTFSAV